MSATVDGDVVRVVDEPQQGVPWRRIGVLVGSGFALALVLVGIGRAITALPESNAFLVWEEGVNRWFVSIRTPTLDTLTHVGSYLAETVTCIALLVLAMAVCRWKTGRWFEAWVVCAAIVGELWVFLVVTFLVDLSLIHI